MLPAARSLAFAMTCPSLVPTIHAARTWSPSRSGGRRSAGSNSTIVRNLEAWFLFEMTRCAASARGRGHSAPIGSSSRSSENCFFEEGERPTSCGVLTPTPGGVFRAPRPPPHPAHGPWLPSRGLLLCAWLYGAASVCVTAERIRISLVSALGLSAIALAAVQVPVGVGARSRPVRWFSAPRSGRA